MYRKLTALLFIILLSLLQSSSVIAQTSTNDNLVSLLGKSNAVVTIDVKKMLTETAPEIFNNDPTAMEKLQTSMKFIENETGVNPFKVNKIALGLNLGKGVPENGIFVVQTISPVAQTVDGIFQSQVANAKFSTEKNPTYNRLWYLKVKMDNPVISITDEESGELKTEYELLSTNLQNIQTNLGNIKSSKTNAIVIENLKKSVKGSEAILVELDKVFQTQRTFDDLIERRTKLESDLEKIELTDTQRLPKISAVANETDKLEKEFTPRFQTLNGLKDTISSSIGNFFDATSLSDIAHNLNQLPAAEPRRTKALQKELTSLREFQTEFQAKLDKIRQTSPEEIANSDQNNEGAIAIRPLYLNVSRRDETIGGKKVITITTKTRYNGEKGEDYTLDDTTENAIGLTDETTLIYGKSDTIKKILENKTANQNATMTNLINRSPNSLMAFAFDLQEVDLSALGNLLGDKPTVWQVFGSLTSANKEISLTATVEKTDIPLKVSPPNPATDNAFKLPVVETNSAATDMLALLAKTLIGVEGKLTFKFDKRKTTALIEETPKLFGALMRNNNGRKK